jgi:hypothetical protein
VFVRQNLKRGLTNMRDTHTTRDEIAVASGAKLDAIGSRFKMYRHQGNGWNGPGFFVETDYNFRNRVLIAFDREHAQ